jgi:putative nucleotidyltransferase with HDIG domain
MPPPHPTVIPQRGRDLCHLAFRQTLDLLRVTDGALEELCTECLQVAGLDTLVIRALNEMALGERAEGTRAPAHVFLIHGPAPTYTGILYRLEKTGYRPVTGALPVPVEEFRFTATGSNEVTLSNPEDEEISIAEYQRRFPPHLVQALGDEVRNYIAYRIAGDWAGALVALNYPGRATRYEAQVLSALAITLGSLWTLTARIGQVEESFLYLVGALARASEVNDEVTGDHILRVSRCAEALARKLGCSPEQARTIGYSAQLHDVGKLHTPGHILRKPGPLTAPEEEVMRQHTVQGEKIIGASPRLQVARRIAGNHHENWDGSGYPRGLSGEEIPLEARLVKVVDVYDALRAQRPYKPPLSHEQACQVMQQGDRRTDPARHFDPEILAAFREIHQEFRRIHVEVLPWP